MLKNLKRSSLPAAYKERSRVHENVKCDFLGKTADNIYNPVCIAWTGSKQWERNCGSLFWTADSLFIPVMGSESVPGLKQNLNLVAVEQLMVNINCKVRFNSVFLFVLTPDALLCAVGVASRKALSSSNRERLATVCRCSIFAIKKARFDSNDVIGYRSRARGKFELSAI